MDQRSPKKVLDDTRPATPYLKEGVPQTGKTNQRFTERGSLQNQRRVSRRPTAALHTRAMSLVEPRNHSLVKERSPDNPQLMPRIIRQVFPPNAGGSADFEGSRPVRVRQRRSRNGRCRFFEIPSPARCQ